MPSKSFEITAGAINRGTRARPQIEAVVRVNFHDGARARVEIAPVERSLRKTVAHATALRKTLERKLKHLSVDEAVAVVAVVQAEEIEAAKAAENTDLWRAFYGREIERGLSESAN
jgi:hypothetical protein